MPKPSAQKNYRQTCFRADCQRSHGQPEMAEDTLRAAGKSLTEFNADVGKAHETLKATRVHGKRFVRSPRGCCPE